MSYSSNKHSDTEIYTNVSLLDSSTDVSEFLKERAIIRGYQPIENQCIALYCKVPQSFFAKNLHLKEGFNSTNGHVLAVLQIQRLVGGLGFPGGKAENEDPSPIKAALREFEEETLFDLTPLIRSGKVYLEPEPIQMYDSGSNVYSAMHLVEANVETFFTIMYSINNSQQEDLINFAVNNGKNKIIGKEVCSVLPVYLTDFTIRNIHRQAAFKIPAAQLEHLVQLFYRKAI